MKRKTEGLFVGNGPFIGLANQCKQHFLNFLPLPQGQGSLRPTFGSLRMAVAGGA
jgi:hypothetical protein